MFFWVHVSFLISKFLDKILAYKLTITVNISDREEEDNFHEPTSDIESDEEGEVNNNEETEPSTDELEIQEGPVDEPTEGPSQLLANEDEGDIHYL